MRPNINPIIFLVITNDRHSDLEVEAYFDHETARKRAKDLTLSYMRDGDSVDITLTNEPIANYRPGLILFTGIYSCEGDNVKVMCVELLPSTPA